MPPTGTCSKCGKKYTEWALQREEHRKCNRVTGRHEEKCNGEIVLLDKKDEKDDDFVPVS